MKRTLALFAFAALLAILAVGSSSLPVAHAADTPAESLSAPATVPSQGVDPVDGGGRWEDVCCGPSCEEDYCTGSGDLTCCK